MSIVLDSTSVIRKNESWNDDIKYSNNIGTIVGILGTIVGIIDSFYAIEAAQKPILNLSQWNRGSFNNNGLAVHYYYTYIIPIQYFQSSN